MRKYKPVYNTCLYFNHNSCDNNVKPRLYPPEVCSVHHLVYTVWWAPGSSTALSIAWVTSNQSGLAMPASPVTHWRPPTSLKPRETNASSERPPKLSGPPLPCGPITAFLLVGATSPSGVVPNSHLGGGVDRVDQAGMASVWSVVFNLYGGGGADGVDQVGTTSVSGVVSNSRCGGGADGVEQAGRPPCTGCWSIDRASAGASSPAPPLQGAATGTGTGPSVPPSGTSLVELCCCSVKSCGSSPALQKFVASRSGGGEKTSRPSRMMKHSSVL